MERTALATLFLCFFINSNLVNSANLYRNKDRGKQRGGANLWAAEADIVPNTPFTRTHRL